MRVNLSYTALGTGQIEKKLHIFNGKVQTDRVKYSDCGDSKQSEWEKGCLFAAALSSITVSHQTNGVITGPTV